MNLLIALYVDPHGGRCASCQTTQPVSQSQTNVPSENCLLFFFIPAPKDGTDILSLNVGNTLPLLAAK